jgi:MFS transporter, MHS family, alpha-ketoglutarate permease
MRSRSASNRHHSAVPAYRGVDDRVRLPTKVRALGVELPYALTVSLFGGTADSVALSFKNWGHKSWYAYDLTGMIAISLVVYVFMPDTKADSAMHRHE